MATYLRQYEVDVLPLTPDTTDDALAAFDRDYRPTLYARRARGYLVKRQGYPVKWVSADEFKEEFREAEPRPRLRVLALTPETVGDTTTTPFVIVIDRASSMTEFTSDDAQHLNQEFGSRTIFFSRDEIDLETTGDASPQLIAALAVAVR